MAEIAPPDRGQPFDLSYILTMVSEINNLSRIISSKAVKQSSIKPANASSTTQVITSDLVFYAATNSLTPNFGVESTLTTRFDFSFQSPPIITTSITSTSGQTPPVFAVVTNVTSTGCEIKLFAAGTVTGNPGIDVSIIAMGR